jgi:PAS domain S-box-containing protein
VTAGRDGEPREIVARALQPPIGDPRFWVVQALIAVIGLLQVADWSARLYLHAGPPPDVLNWLFLVPILYAALNFGLAGSMATAIWVVAIDAVMAIRWHDPARIWSSAALGVTMLVVGYLVGHRVEREVRARREAQAARQAADASEERMRSLFESSPAPTLLVDAGGVVQEANPAAMALFGRGRAELVGAGLGEITGGDGAALLEGSEAAITLQAAGGTRYLRAVVSPPPGMAARTFQIVFLDVSEERRRLGVKDAYAAYMIKAQEEERARIAQELHDEPLQELIRLCHQLDRMDGVAVPDIRRTAEGVVDQLRRLASGLRPPALEELGLPATLRRLTRDLEALLPGLAVSLEVTGEVRRLDPAVELNLFRIAQEALRNVERHAAASRVDVELAYEPASVRLRAGDDGRGFEPEAESAAGGRLGLVGMHERADLIGGRIEVTSRVGRGTSVEVVVPAMESADVR